MTTIDKVQSPFLLPRLYVDTEDVPLTVAPESTTRQSNQRSDAPPPILASDPATGPPHPPAAEDEMAGWIATIPHVQGADRTTQLLDQWRDDFGGEPAGWMRDVLNRIVANEPPPDLADVLEEVAKTIQRYVHFASTEQVWAATLWVAHTYILDGFDVSPRLAIRAPSKQSGKTKLMEVIKELANNGWHVVGPSAAVLFRKIERDRPTILLDEADRLFKRRAEDTADVIQVLNTGHARGSVVPRVVGPKHELHDFPAFAAVALAGIGTDWPDTIIDRSIIINMERKTSGEDVERLRRHAKAELRELGLRLAASLSCVETFTVDDLPDELSDRAQDGWEPLLAIADAASGDWPKDARQAAITLSNSSAHVSTEREELLALRDMRAVFEKREDPAFLPTDFLLIGLRSVTESPWNDDPRPLTASKLAGLMKTFGIKSVQPARGANRGYKLKDIERHWGRLKTSDEPLASLIPDHAFNNYDERNEASD